MSYGRIGRNVGDQTLSAPKVGPAYKDNVGCDARPSPRVKTRMCTTTLPEHAHVAVDNTLSTPVYIIGTRQHLCTQMTWFTADTGDAYSHQHNMTAMCIRQPN